ncbi:MAG TPA: M23 family metallopeptidase, partial [bacterium]|nr:M23 family metallopeptidase [bacterium]
GHPAHDLFILDRDYDSRNDRTRRPVPVLALTGGVVVATSPRWAVGSPLRGGKYVWVYSPPERAFFYYAHNDSLLVVPGDVVRAGDALAFVGRTGRNAYLRRSPTHLHLMQLTLDARNRPQPADCYPRLRQARLLR